MKLKLDQYIAQMKQVHGPVLQEYKEVKQLIRDYVSDEQNSSPFDAALVIRAETIEQKISSIESKLEQYKGTDIAAADLNRAFSRYVNSELIFTLVQIQNRYTYKLKTQYAEDVIDFQPTNLDYKSSSIAQALLTDSLSEEEQHELIQHDDIQDVCLHFLTSVACNKSHDVHRTLLSVMSPHSYDELFVALTEASREHLGKEKRPTAPIASDFNTLQLLVWAMDQHSDDSFDLSNEEFAFLHDKHKWCVLAAAYQVMNKHSLKISVWSIFSDNLDKTIQAFSQTGRSVNRFILEGYSIMPLSTSDAKSTGKLLRKLNVNTLELVYNNLGAETNREYLNNLLLVLKTGKVKNAALRGDAFYKISYSEWSDFCKRMADTGVESVDFDQISSQRLNELRTALKKVSTAPNSLFHHPTISDSSDASKRSASSFDNRM